MSDRRPLVLVNGRVQEMPVGDKVPAAALGSGTPTGAKFLRDDGVFAVPVGGGGGGGTNTAVVMARVVLGI